MTQPTVWRLRCGYCGCEFTAPAAREHCSLLCRHRHRWFGTVPDSHKGRAPRKFSDVPLMTRTLQKSPSRRSRGSRARGVILGGNGRKYARPTGWSCARPSQAFPAPPFLWSTPMTTVRDLVTDLDDQDVQIHKGLVWQLGRPSEDSAWPPRVEGFFHTLAAGLDQELCRRQQMVQDLRDSTGEGGVGGLACEDHEDLSGWTFDTGDAA